MIIEEKSRQAKEKAEQIAKSLHLPLLKKGDPVYLNTSSSSMYPFVKGGDTIKVAPVKETDIKIGDIIAVDNEDKDKAWFYAHRVVRKFKDNGSNFFVTKGDASREGMDEPVGFSKIAGRVINIKRNGLKIDLESPFWKRLNRYIAKASLRYPNALRNLAPWISLAIEWRRFFSKLGRRIDEPLSNTEELILICARTNIDKGLINRAKELITRGLDWDLFSEASVKSGLPIIFYNCLEKIGYPAAVPAELMDKLKISYLSAIPRINFQYEEAKRLLRLFFEKDLPAVPLKGSFLSKRIYGDIAARGLSADFDLLVEENSLEAAKKILEGAGWTFVPENESIAWNRQWIFKKPDGILVELHWGIRPEVQSQERMKELFKGIRLKNEDDLSYYELREEELLIFLAAHYIGSKHSGQLRYACDINELISRHGNTLDWGGVVKKSKEWRLSGSVYASLLLCRSLFQSYIPDEAVLGVKPGLIKRVLIRIAVGRNTILRAGSFGRRLMGGFLKYILLQALETNSLKDCAALLFPPEEFMGGKSYAKRLKGGVLKLIKSLKECNSSAH